MMTSAPSSEVSQRLNHFPYSATSMHSWFNCLDHFGTRKMNEIGQHLVQLSCCHRLCVSNTYFNMKSYHRGCWRHPKSNFFFFYQTKVRYNTYDCALRKMFLYWQLKYFYRLHILKLMYHINIHIKLRGGWHYHVKLLFQAA